MTRRISSAAGPLVGAVVMLGLALLLITHPHALDFVLRPLVEAAFDVVLACGRLVAYVLELVLTPILGLPRS